MSARAYLSIGDVLTLLRQEFPDVTISKIRFLESQGLVNPERTPSGYRKFYEPDVERLRWVLRQQRENFLPLKVIKGRLEETTDEPGNGHGHQHQVAAPAPATPAPRATAPEPAFVGGDRRPAEGRSGQPAPAARGLRGEPLPGLGTGRGAEPATEELAATEEPAEATAPAAPATRAPTPPPAAPRRPTLRAEEPVPEPAEGDMTLDELVAASGCPHGVVTGLESYGLLSGRSIGGVIYYAEDALAIARLAAAFSAFGVEPRHLRLHKHAAEREAGFIEQVVLPLLKQRNPESRRRAHESVGELSRLGQELRALLLRRALRDQLGG